MGRWSRRNGRAVACRRRSGQSRRIATWRGPAAFAFAFASHGRAIHAVFQVALRAELSFFSIRRSQVEHGAPLWTACPTWLYARRALDLSLELNEIIIF